MVADIVNGNILLFGGYDTASNTALTDTWTWDGQAWTQHDVAGPPAREMAAATSSQALEVLIAGVRMQRATHWLMSGTGMARPGRCARIYLQLGPLPTWASNLPTAESILVGGQRIDGCCHGGTLVYDIAQDQWRLAHDDDGLAVDTWGSGMTQTALEAELVRFGGEVGAGNLIRDTWYWSSSRWRLDGVQNPVCPRSNGHGLRPHSRQYSGLWRGR